MKKLLQSLSVTVLLSSLIACGGGGGGDGGTTTPTNTAPKLSVSTTSLSLSEGTTDSFEVTGSDADGDKLTYSVESEDSVLTATYTNGSVKLTASDVEEDKKVNVVVKVSDGKLSASKTVAVNIKNIYEGDNESPVVSYTPISEIKEGQTLTFPLSATDADGDQLTFKVTSSNPALQGSYNSADELVTVTATEVEEDTMIDLMIEISDGKTPVEFSTAILVVSIPDPTIVVEDSLELQENASTVLSMTTEEGNVVEVTSSDETVMKAVYTGKSITVETFEIEEDKMVSLTIKVTSELGKTTEKMVGVLVTNIGDGEVANPEIDLVGADVNNTLPLYSGENSIKVVLTGDESKTLTWDIKEFKGIEEADAVLDTVELYEKRGDTFYVEMKQGIERIVNFSLVLTMSDGVNTYDSEVYTLSLTSRPNSKPLFFIDNKVNGGALVPVGTTKTFKINILDDSPENVVIEESNSMVWFNEGADFDYTIDSAAQTITISSTETEVNKSFGVWVLYTDGEIREYMSLRFTTSMVLTQLQKSTLDYVQEVNNKISALKEYQYIADFYTEVAENQNLMTEFEVKSVKQNTKLLDSYDYSVLLASLFSLEANVAIGTAEGQSAEWIDSMVQLIDSRLAASTATYNRNAYEIVNDLSNKTSGLLPRFDYTGSLVEYDAMNKFSSHFKGNTEFGEYVDSEFVFFDEYKFLNAVVEKMEESALQTYQY